MDTAQRILVVDDDRAVAMGLGMRLKSAGFHVSFAHDGGEGFSAAVENRPDAILLDLRMPVMDGFTVLAKLRERDDTRAIPVIVLSANVADRAEQRALDNGAKYFLEKPYQPKALFAALESAMKLPAN